MFVRNDHDLGGAGGAATMTFGRARVVARPSLGERLGLRLSAVELVPDLGADIGSRTWWQGAATCGALIAATVMLAPGFDRPTYRLAAPSAAGAQADEVRAQAIAPLAFGGGSGRRMAATGRVQPLTDTPERPTLELNAALADGTALARTLERAGVGADDAAAAAALVAERMPLAELQPGTQLAVVLGRRPAQGAARPLERLSLRARFDLAMAVARSGGTLALTALPIAIDRTPLRIQGQVGASLYRSARAAGVPAKAVEAFLRSVASRMPVSRIDAGATFDVIVEQSRAATGEVQLGQLLYAGLRGGGADLQLMRFEQGGKDSWFDAKGVGARTAGAAMMPVVGRLTSGFGMRRHPVLGYARMHKGMDIAAPSGAPIRAPMDGTVRMAGWAGGYGRFVKLAHADGLATGFGHMSRIAVSNGQRVRRGDVIGYVGSTGISTGPHLHYELWKNGVPTNPGKVTFESVQTLHGGALSSFKSRLARLLSVEAAD